MREEVCIECNKGNCLECRGIDYSFDYSYNIYHFKCNHYCRQFEKWAKS